MVDVKNCSFLNHDNVGYGGGVYLKELNHF